MFRYLFTCLVSLALVGTTLGNGYYYGHTYYTTPSYGYSWYGAQSFNGRYWPAGYYQYTGYGWYRSGYGYEYGTPIIQVPVYAPSYPAAPVYAPSYPAAPAPTCPSMQKTSSTDLDKVLLEILQLQKQILQQQMQKPEQK